MWPPRGRDSLSFKTTVVVTALITWFLFSVGPVYYQSAGESPGIQSFQNSPSSAGDCLSVHEDLMKLVKLVLTYLNFKDFSPTYGRDNPEMHKIASNIQFLQEDLDLQFITSEEARSQMHKAIRDAEKKLHQIYSETQECTQNLLASEEARERADSYLSLQLEKQKLWESRARALGWYDELEEEAYKERGPGTKGKLRKML